MRYVTCVLWIMLVVLFRTPSARAQSTAQPAPQQSEDLSARATDPTAALMSFSFVNDFHTSLYDLDDQGFEFRFQPVVPFRAWGTGRLIHLDARLAETSSY